MGGSMEDALVFYRQYHKNKWNQLIHIVFVPVIMWTVLVWLAYAPPLANMPDVFASEPWLDAAHKCVPVVVTGPDPHTTPSAFMHVRGLRQSILDGAGTQYYKHFQICCSL